MEIKPYKYDNQYLIYSDGRVYSLKSNRFLSICKNSHGYALVSLYCNGKHITPRVNRLVAETFLPNPNNLPEVNHKDENPMNNDVNNLEWCDKKYNMNYGTRTERAKQKQQKPVLRISKNNEIIEYNGINEAARENNCNASDIIRVCKGTRKTCAGFIWKYKN